MTYAVNYIGLRKRDTYNELIDYLLDKQPSIIYPDRTATFIRNSPILSNLLDGDGMGSVYWQEQQINRIKEEQKEHAIQQAEGTAQFLRTVDRKPRIENIKTTDDGASDGVEYFDLDYDDHLQDHKDEIEMAIDQKITDEERQRQIMREELNNSLGHVSQHIIQNIHSIPISQPQISHNYLNVHNNQSTYNDNRSFNQNTNVDNRANVLNYAPASSSTDTPPIQVDPVYQKKLVDQPKEKRIKGQTAIQGQTKEEKKLKPAPKPKPKPKSYSRSSSSTDAPSSTPLLTPKFEKEKKMISPSVIGIQAVREALETAKVRKNLTTESISNYMKLYDEWKAAKGNKDMKKEKLQGLRQIYKRELFRK